MPEGSPMVIPTRGLLWLLGARVTRFHRRGKGLGGACGLPQLIFDSVRIVLAVVSVILIQVLYVVL